MSDLLFSFEGRINRTTWWGYFVPYFLVYLCLLVVGVIGKVPFLPFVYGLIMLYPTLAVNVKRCHDRGRSGWFVLVGLIPIVGIWYLIEICFLRGTVGTNEYGADPV